MARIGFTICRSCCVEFFTADGHKCLKKKTKSVPAILDDAVRRSVKPVTASVADALIVVDDAGQPVDTTDILLGGEDICPACGQKIVAAMTGAERQRRFRERKRSGEINGCG